MISKIIKWLTQALTLQLFLLSLSFPVLVTWGIAFSPLIFLGNILFTPVLTVFLAGSCLVYIFEILGMPNGYICMLLDAIAQAWVYSMSLAPDLGMVACPQAPVWLLILMPLGSWAILKNYGLKDSLATVSFLTLWVFIVFLGIKYYFTPDYKEFVVPCGARAVTLMRKDKKIILIDNESALYSRACSTAWIDYTLSSQLAKNFGATTIDSIIVSKNTPVTRDRLAALCKKYHCQKVFDIPQLGLQI